MTERLCTKKLLLTKLEMKNKFQFKIFTFHITIHIFIQYYAQLKNQVSDKNFQLVLMNFYFKAQYKEKKNYLCISNATQ